VQKEEEKKGDSEEKENNGGGYISEGGYGDEYISEEGRDNNDTIPSDLTVDHHPSRECEYFFGQESDLGEANNNEENTQAEWTIGDLCVSEKFRLLKDNTLKLKESPDNLSTFRCCK
jgi:hypothetical protein